MLAPEPPHRLVVLHHAGGSAQGYLSWRRHLPRGWEVWPVDAPGRGQSASLPAHSRLGPVVERLAHLLDECPGPPTALFGHSIGAVTAYALAERLCGAGDPSRWPVWVGVSARPGPAHGAPAALHRATGPVLRETMRRLSGPTSDQAWSRVERRLRADLEAGETFVPRRADPLPVPLSAFGGRSDPSVTEQALSGWFARTTRFLGVRMFAGGHFYFRPDPSALLAAVVRDIRSATATTFDTFARP